MKLLRIILPAIALMTAIGAGYASSRTARLVEGHYVWLGQCKPCTVANGCMVQTTGTLCTCVNGEQAYNAGCTSFLRRTP